ncbi:DUF7196 family protein [Nocardia nova]|uniref:DUF7196 family protein n=1 Tax=Nocardia nova TaxID=37330 RepID=UPI001895950D|nr:hypothetical protein [Nocardia nova]MBF6277059.1 hypothetical protein [Nocardia nova]
MACACRGGRSASTSTSGNWFVYPSAGGEPAGPFLTTTEARIKAQELGGGIIKQIVPTA